jgi:uncharacterized membrane protein
MPAPYSASHEACAQYAVKTVPVSQPLAWLARGWADMCSATGPSLLHGVLVALGGIAILALTARYSSVLLPGAFSGFVIVGPILATGLYELSRVREHGGQPGFADVLAAWRRGTRPLVWLGVLLFLAGTLWVLMSAVIFKLFVRVPIADPLSFLRYAVGTQGNLLFSLWTILGGLGAALVFAATVVSAPLLLDRHIELRDAVYASIRAVGENPSAMAFWAALIMLATALSVATLSIGFVLAVPVIGHATWHAYRDLLDTRTLPARHR